MHIVFVTFFNLFVFHLQADVVGSLQLNASLLLVLTTDYSDWLAQVTQLILTTESESFHLFICLTSRNIQLSKVCAVGPTGLCIFFLR